MTVETATTPNLQNQKLKVAAAELVLASFVVLFQEMTLIRWLPSQVRVLAYFPNVVLISAFLGLGIGSLRSDRRSLLTAWPVALAVLVGAALAMGKIAFTQESVSEHLWLLYYDIPNAPVIKGVRGPIILLFILTGCSFIPLGQLVAARLLMFKDEAGSLWGYSCDLLGSLIGVIGFAIASFERTFPLIWFAAFLIPAGWFFLASRARLPKFIYIAGAIAVLGLVVAAKKADRYSPYYAINARSESGTSMVDITVNGSLHQCAAALARSDAPGTQMENDIRTGYHAPYRLLRWRTPRVLVLGAGSGNDVAVALDEGAEHVDAVEIDPVIIELGKSMHPDHPYSSSRVRVINTDARQYLESTKEKYDLIVFGTLDSMTRLSALASVRLDNFVYTEDCLRAARARLTPRGGIVMYFMVGSEYIQRRLLGMVAEAFQQPAFSITHFCYLFNKVIAAGPAFIDPAEVHGALPDWGIELPSDDWPFLYLQSRGVDWFYTSLILTFALLATAGIAAATPNFFRSAASGSLSVDLEMFLFGVGFLLLETKSVTEMNLVWGVTWVTSAVVFGSILVMLLAATITMQLRPMSWRTGAALLIVSLMASYAMPVSLLLGHGVAASLALSALFVGLPIFFASVCFALRFRVRSQPALAFGWNLLGAVAGGLIEFTSMAIGFRALALVALLAYLAAFLLGMKRAAKASLAHTT